MLTTLYTTAHWFDLQEEDEEWDEEEGVEEGADWEEDEDFAEDEEWEEE